MAIVGCNFPNRFIEQHDIFFGIAPSLVDLKPKLIEFWPEIAEKLHIDSYRTVTKVGNYIISVIDAANKTENGWHLYFLNLGGYKPDDMEEYHYKQLIVASSMAEAMQIGKKNVFWQHHTEPHIDNKYGIDVDDAYLVEDMLPADVRNLYRIQIDEDVENSSEDELHIGYLKLSKLQ